MLRAIAIAILWLLASAASVQAAQTGIASYYWQGRLTANGERYNPNGLTAAHRRLPFGTLVKVTMLRSGRSIVVRINDRGPFIRGRIIDLSRGAARRIGLVSSGVARVKIEVVGRRGSSRYVGNARSRRAVAGIAKRRAVGGAKRVIKRRSVAQP